MKEMQRRLLIRLVEQELSYLADNLYRYQHFSTPEELKTTKTQEIIKDHEESIKLAKETKEFLYNE